MVNVAFSETQFKVLWDFVIYSFLFVFFAIFLVSLIVLSDRRRRSKVRAVEREDDFYRVHGYSWDYILVFAVYSEEERENLTDTQKLYTMKNVIDRCQQAKLETKCFYSCQRDEIYLKLRAEPFRIAQEADRVDYKLLLDHTSLAKHAKTGKYEVNELEPEKKGDFLWKPIIISNEFNTNGFGPYEFIYAKYDQDPLLQDLYTLYPLVVSTDMPASHRHPFRTIDRIKLLLSILESGQNLTPSGCGLSLRKMTAEGAVLAHFPLHEYGVLNTLQQDWIKVFAMPSSQPIDRIKNYLGEKIGLYFVFLEYYSTRLIIPALLGCGVFAYTKAEETSEGTLMPYYAVLMAIWSTVFIERWKNLQITTALKWGVVGFEDEEQDRVEFQGIASESPVDGSPMLYYSDDKKLLYTLFTGIILFCNTILVFLVVVAINFLQHYMNNKSRLNNFTAYGKNCTGFISAAVLSVCISVLSQLFHKLALNLNDMQNHRTDTAYDDSLGLKIFIFEIFNSFSYCFFLAFIKSPIGFFCMDNDCVQEISDTLLVLLLVTLFKRCIKEVVINKYVQQKKYDEETSNVEPGSVVGEVEKQYIMPEYTQLAGTFQDYAFLVIQYGYTSLFIAAFPIGPWVSLLSSFVQIRIDAWKFCQCYRRPEPRTSEDIGIWQDMVSFLGTMSVIINFGIIFFSSTYMIDITWTMRWVTFICVEHVAITIKTMLGIVIEDVPEVVQTQLDRQEILVRKVIFNEKDETEADFFSLEKPGPISIAITDVDWVYPDPEEEDANDKGGDWSGGEEEKDNGGTTGYAAVSSSGIDVNIADSML